MPYMIIKNKKKDFVMTIIFIICWIVVFVIYHQIFDVIYFKGGCLSEIIGVSIVAAILSALVVQFWFISIPVIIFAIYALLKGKN